MRTLRWFLAPTLAIAVGVALAACSTPAVRDDGTDAPGDLAWLDIELVDAVTGETFRISDFAGEPVLIQGFAVW